MWGKELIITSKFDILTSMEQKEFKKGEIVIYKTPQGPQLNVTLEKQTVWLTQAQIALLFDIQRPAVTKHTRNIFNEGELKENSVCSILEHTATDGKKYKTAFYNLDAIISIGYRVNSKRATQFRIWATNVLRSHIVEGYTINRNRVVENYGMFMKAVEQVRLLLLTGSVIENKDILELISFFADTWFSLNAYDKSQFTSGKLTKKKITLTSQKLIKNIEIFKGELLQKGGWSDVFGVEKEKNSVEGIIGNVMQSFGGKELYESIEEKAVNLLYFIVKDHPFIDGNKRIGAYSFIWFLRTAGILNTARITPSALTALTLLIAESNPKEKERVVGLVKLIVSNK